MTRKCEFRAHSHPSFNMTLKYDATAEEKTVQGVEKNKLALLPNNQKLCLQKPVPKFSLTLTLKNKRMNIVDCVAKWF